MKWFKYTSSMALSLLLLNQINKRVEPKEAWQPPHLHNPKVFLWKKGKVVYNVYGQGEPVLLVHGFGTGASSYEWHKNVDELAQHYKVYTLDLLGFGLSDKPNLNYTPEVYIKLIHDFIFNVIREPVQCIAQTHTCSYIIQLMHDVPDIFKKAILVNPYGFEHHFDQNGMAQVMTTITHLPIINRSFFNLMSSPWNVKSFLQGEFYDTEMITEETITHYHQSALENYPYAYLAPAAFLRGKLNHIVEQQWVSINQPTVIFAGKQSNVYPISYAEDFFRLNKQTELHTFERAGLFLQIEEAYTFNQTAISFLQEH